MKTKTVLVAAALAVLAASSANASSGNSKFYIKANAGYGFSKQSLGGKINGSSISFKKNGKGFIGGGSIGANLSSNVRTDLEVIVDDGLRARSKLANTATTRSYKMKTQAYAGLVNASYDFKNSTKFTPFITGGVGYGSSKYKTSSTLNGVTTNLTSKKSNGLAYQAGLGVGAELGKATLEVGYRFIDFGAKKRTINGSNPATTAEIANRSSGRANVVMGSLRVGF